MANKTNSQCLQKAADDEPIFVLRAQDQSAPSAIIHWIGENIHTCTEEKLHQALDVAIEMRKYPKKKVAD